ncbi:hypothetical protein [Cupriavidus sp. IK-TO18]|uniref:hypothetical protein n=1 Tax=Cupriavidus sp. IK-TO18 TaxID=2782182 RepID=UPI00189858CD|nr:hypothetical protein [Cupriavidus sp. IK-TO18]MBF6989211.1 hypothetical protein [Cupriavidus sp. IK-TO18]
MDLCLDRAAPAAKSNWAASASGGYRGKLGSVTIAGTYSLGRDVVSAPAGANCGAENPADKQACSGWSAMIAYDIQAVAAAYAALLVAPPRVEVINMNEAFVFAEMKRGQWQFAGDCAELQDAVMSFAVTPAAQLQIPSTPRQGRLPRFGALAGKRYRPSAGPRLRLSWNATDTRSAG